MRTARVMRWLALAACLLWCSGVRAFDGWTQGVIYDGTVAPYGGAESVFARNKATRDEAGIAVAANTQRWARDRFAWCPALQWELKLPQVNSGLTLGTGAAADGTPILAYSRTGGTSTAVGLYLYAWDKAARTLSQSSFTAYNAFPGSGGGVDYTLQACSIYNGWIGLWTNRRLNGLETNPVIFHAQSHTAPSWQTMSIPANPNSLNGQGDSGLEGIFIGRLWNSLHVFPKDGLGYTTHDRDNDHAVACWSEYMSTSGYYAGISSVTDQGGFCRINTASRFPVKVGQILTTANLSGVATSGREHVVTNVVDADTFDTNVAIGNAPNPASETIKKLSLGWQCGVFPIDRSGGVWTTGGNNIFLSEWRTDIKPVSNTTYSGTNYHCHVLAPVGDFLAMGYGDGPFQNGFDLFGFDYDNPAATTSASRVVGWQGGIDLNQLSAGPPATYTGDISLQISSIQPGPLGSAIGGGDVDYCAVGRIPALASSSGPAQTICDLYLVPDKTSGTTNDSVLTANMQWYPGVGWLTGGHGGDTSYSGFDPLVFASRTDAGAWALVPGVGAFVADPSLPMLLENNVATWHPVHYDIYVAKLPRFFTCRPLHLSPAARNLLAEGHHDTQEFCQSTAPSGENIVNQVTYDEAQGRYEYNGIDSNGAEAIAGNPLATQPVGRPPSMSDLTVEMYSNSPFSSFNAGYRHLQTVSGGPTAEDVDPNSLPLTLLCYRYMLDGDMSTMSLSLSDGAGATLGTRSHYFGGTGRWEPVVFQTETAPDAAGRFRALLFTSRSSNQGGGVSKQLLHFASLSEKCAGVPYPIDPNDDGTPPQELETARFAHTGAAWSIAAFLGRPAASTSVDQPLFTIWEDAANYVAVSLDVTGNSWAQTAQDVVVTCVRGGSTVGTGTINLGPYGWVRNTGQEIIVTDNGTDVTVGLVPMVNHAAGTLTNSTTLTMGASTHGINTGDTIDLVWNDGNRRGITAGTVSGTTVPISGGTGDALPANGTAIQTLVSVKTVAIAGGSLQTPADLEVRFSDATQTTVGQLYVGQVRYAAEALTRAEIISQLKGGTLFERPSRSRGFQNLELAMSP